MDRKSSFNGIFSVVRNDSLSRLIMNYTSCKYSHLGVYIKRDDSYNWSVFSIIGQDKLVLEDMSVDEFLAQGYSSLTMISVETNLRHVYDHMFVDSSDSTDPMEQLHFKTINGFTVLGTLLLKHPLPFIAPLSHSLRGKEYGREQFFRGSEVEHPSVVSSEVYQKYSTMVDQLKYMSIACKLRKLVVDLNENGVADTSLLADISSSLLDDSYKLITGYVYIKPIQLSGNDNSARVKSILVASLSQ